VGKRGTGSKGARACRGVAGERAIMGASTAGERGRKVRDAEVANGWGPRGREKERARWKETTPTGQPHRAARKRGRESAWVGAERQDPPVRHRGHAGACAELG
jgi:hypothetical protein